MVHRDQVAGKKETPAALSHLSENSPSELAFWKLFQLALHFNYTMFL